MIHNSCARKLIEGGAIYADHYGFKPHRDYKMAKQIFGEIDATACPRVKKIGTIKYYIFVIFGLLILSLCAGSIIKYGMVKWKKTPC
jgi:hypothetical protein